MIWTGPFPQANPQKWKVPDPPPRLSGERELRDEFAMAVAGALIADGNDSAELIAKAAYKVADAMMKARSEV